MDKNVYITDVSHPVDTNVGKEERQKLGEYGALGVEAERMWGVKAEVIPVILGGLGAVTKNLGDNLAKIPGFPDSCICPSGKGIIAPLVFSLNHPLYRKFFLFHDFDISQMPDDMFDQVKSTTGLRIQNKVNEILRFIKN